MATTINAPTPITPSTKAAPVAERAPSVRTQPDERLLSLDTYRGFIMIVLASGGLGIYEVARKHFPDDPTWQTLGYHFHHVKWLGCAFWDLIQPSFMFMVGVAMAYSYAARKAHGQPYWRMLVHAITRSVVLVLLGVFLRSGSGTQTNWTFMDVVSQIGLGYTFLFLLWGKPRLWQGVAAATILIGYWLLFAFYPLPAEDFDFAKVGVSTDWPHLTALLSIGTKGRIRPRISTFGF